MVIDYSLYIFIALCDEWTMGCRSVLKLRAILIVTQNQNVPVHRPLTFLPPDQSARLASFRSEWHLVEKAIHGRK